MGEKPKYAVFEKERQLRVSDGTPIRYTVRGRGKAPGEAIVLANGWSCSDAWWVDILPRLEAAGHRIVLPDIRGHGESGLPRDPGPRARNITDDDLSVPRLAADLVEVCRDADVEHAVLVGHSMGVQTILETYRVAPELVRGLVTMAGAYENPLNTFYGRSFWNQLFPIGRVAVGLIPPAFTSVWWKVGDNAAFGLKVAQLVGAAGPKVTQAVIAPYITHMSTRDPVVLFKAIDAMRRHSAADVLPNVEVPVLILVAAKDVFTPPAVARHMHEVLPESEMVEFDDATHCLPVEEPEALAELVDRFATRLIPSGQLQPSDRRSSQ